MFPPYDRLECPGGHKFSSVTQGLYRDVANCLCETCKKAYRARWIDGWTGGTWRLEEVMVSADESKPIDDLPTFEG